MNVWTLFTHYNGDNVVTVHKSLDAANRELATWLEDFDNPLEGPYESESAANWCSNQDFEISYVIEQQRVRD